jgi:hypothetical protein
MGSVSVSGPADAAALLPGTDRRLTIADRACALAFLALSPEDAAAEAKRILARLAKRRKE